MAYINLNVDALRKYCEDIFCKRGYSAEDSKAITDVLLTADLYGIESHGVQRLIRYHLAIEEGSIVPDVKPEIVHETPVSAVIDAPRSMGQVVAK
ncbi:MAG: Ldh family oxidoreductase, partial [Oscillospiraceae bacterium]|nr:Ldh family oxidoreductase [Oscillospiraceae bacterium]